MEGMQSNNKKPDELKTRAELIRELRHLRSSMRQPEKAVSDDPPARQLPGLNDAVYQSMLDAKHLGVIIADSSGCVVKTNAAGRSMLKAEPGELESQSVSALFCEDHRHAIREVFSSAAVSSYSVSVYHFVCRHEQHEPMEVELIRLPDNTRHKDAYMLCLLRRISADVHPQGVAGEAREQLQMLYDQSPNAYFNFDDHLKLLGGNRAAEAMTGYPREKLLGKSIFELGIFSRSQIGTAKLLLEACRKGEQFGPLEVAVTQKTGSVVFVEVTTYPVDLQGDRQFIGIAYDITQRKETEQQLKESETRYKALYENVSVGVYRSTPQGRMLLANPAMIEMLGFSSFEEVAQVDLNENRFSGTQRSEFVKLMKENGEVKEYETVWMRPDGAEVILSESARVVRDPTGKELYYEGVVENVTKRKLAELELLSIKDNLEEMVKERTIALENANELLELEISDRRLAEKALKESEESYRDLVEKAGLAIMMDDNHGKFNYFNSRFTELFGYPEAELLQLSLRELAHPDDQAKVEKILRGRQFNGTTPSRYELKSITSGQEVLYLDIESIPLEDNGKLIGTRNYIRDISEQKEWEENLRFADEILQRAGAIVLSCDQYGRIKYVSPAVTEVLGFTPEELLDNGWWEKSRSSAMEANKEKQYFIDVLSGHKPLRSAPYERVMITRDGEKRWILWQDSRGKNDSIISFGQDVSERKRADDALEESRRMLQLVIDNIPQYILWKDRDSVYLGCNNNFAERAGVERAEAIIGKTDFELNFSVEEANYAVKWDKHVIESGKAYLHTVERQFTQEGGQLVLDTNRIPLFNREGETVGVLITYEDITERVESEEALRTAKEEAEEASKMKSEFVFNVSHEIRTPLNAIIGFSETMLSNPSVDNVERKSGIILRESENLLKLINDLLDHAKIESGKMELEYEPLRLTELFTEIQNSISIHAELKGIDFLIEREDYVPEVVVGDALRLRQILVNLIYNAIKFTEEGYVKLKVKCIETVSLKAKLRFLVIDTGIGIPKEKQQKIFESFAQADGSTTRKYGGTGLGTTIASQLVELMNGTIGLESEPGKGSTFWFEIVLNTAEDTGLDAGAVDDQAEDSQSADAPRGRILVAEDYPPNQEIAQMHLLSAGHSVVIAPDGVGAVEQCEKELFDLVLLDIQMPRMDGYAAIAAIRGLNEHYLSIPILGLTAHADATTRKNCINAGMNDVLTKPIRKKSFLFEVNRWLRKGVAPTQEDFEEIEDFVELDEQRRDEASDVPLDFDVAVEEFGDMETVVAVLEGFIENIERQIGIIGEALTTDNFETIRKESHSLKGGAATLEAAPLSRAAKLMEDLAKEQDTETLEAAFEEFKQQYQRFRQYTTEQTKKYDSGAG